jgi:hypothetical protein
MWIAKVSLALALSLAHEFVETNPVMASEVADGGV